MRLLGGPETQNSEEPRWYSDPKQRRSALPCDIRDRMERGPKAKRPNPWLTDPTLKMTAFSFLLLLVVMIIGVPLLVLDKLPWEVVRLGPWKVERQTLSVDGLQRPLVSLISQDSRAEPGPVTVSWPDQTLDFEVWADPASPQAVLLTLPADAQAQPLTLIWQEEQKILPP